MSEFEQKTQDVNASNKRVTFRLLLVVVGMFGFGYALVPLYDIICEVTGLNGKTGQVTAAEVSGPDLSRTVTVKFTASVNEFAPWDFEPNEVTMEVHPGGLYNTSYKARNKTQKALIGQAAPSVTPREASLYFNKTECFCFIKQAFEAGEARDMPVQFVVDRELPAHIETLVLSYTMFDVTDKS